MPPWQRPNLIPAGPSTASDPDKLLNPKRTTDVLRKPDNCKSYRHVGVAFVADPILRAETSAAQEFTERLAKLEREMVALRKLLNRLRAEVSIGSDGSSS